MLMHSAPEPFNREGWFFEPKMDGMRCITIWDGVDVYLISRNGLDFAPKYPALAAELRKILRSPCVLDGEIVAYDSFGRPSFERLQERIVARREDLIRRSDSTNPVQLFLFDALSFDGRNVTGLPLISRRELLAAEVRETGLVKRLEVFDDGIALFRASGELGLEGVVGKNKSSIYQCGIRSKNWVKVKHSIRTDVVIGGHRPDIGFLVGSYVDDNRLRYVGSVMGGLRGEDYEYLDKVLVLRESSPFIESSRAPRTLWFEPHVVAEVKFMHWTSGGLLRMPTFTRLRLDLSAMR
jgi:bifunctional non-homologous end joining protein LigD